MFPHKPIRLPNLNVLAHKGLHQPKELKLDIESSDRICRPKTKASERFLIRTVPLVCGGVLGIHAGHLLMGLLVGFVVAVLLDLRPREQSVIRPWPQEKLTTLPWVLDRFRFRHR